MKKYLTILIVFLFSSCLFGQTSKVKSSQCNTTLSSIGTPIYATSVSGAVAFTFKLKRVSDGLIDSLEKTTGTLNAFSLTNFNTSFINYATTYEVTVKVKVGSIYGNYGAMCTITTPNLIPPTVKATQCGFTLAEIATPIYSNAVSCVEGYRFLVSDGINNTIVYPFATPNAFALTNQAGQTYGGTPSNLTWIGFNKTYQISVSVLDNGVWSSWGIACNVTTPPGSKLTNAMAAKTINYLYYEELIAETIVLSGLEDYQFRYRYSQGTSTYTTATLATESALSSIDNIVKISDFGVVNNYGKTFRVSIRVKYSGIWSPWGTEVVVYSVANPVTKLNDNLYSGVSPVDNCGNSFGAPYTMASVNTNLWSYNLYGFSTYTYEVSKLDGIGNVLSTEFLTRDGAIHGSNARCFNLSLIPSYIGQYNTTFKVRVKTNLGNYGDACYVKTPASIILDPNTNEVNAISKEEVTQQYSGINLIENSASVEFYPNPYSQSISVNYSDEFSGNVDVSIFDLNGKVIYSGNTELDDLITQEFWANLNTSDLIVKISNSENNSITKRISKQK